MYIIEDKIAQKAISFEGETEIKGNKGFKNPVFWKLMESVGFQINDPWCMYFVELVWTEVYKELGAIDIVDKYTKLFSASATQTWSNFKKVKHPMGKIPKKGAIAIYQTYKKGVPHWTGHGAIVTEVAGSWYQTYDGNTLKDKFDRDGGTVAPKEHFNYEALFHVNNGLRLLGFIYVKEFSLNEEDKKIPASIY